MDNNMIVAQQLLDTNSSRIEVVRSDHLKRWSQISPRDLSESDVIGASGVRIHEQSPFPVNHELNKKIALFAGDITLLDCEAIVNTTNESFSDRNPLSARIYAKAGLNMKSHLKENLKFCRTGEAKLSKGYNLPARYVIHTVGPKYNDKFHTAAESALHSCYIKVLQLAVDQKIRSLGICAINSIRRGYPPGDGAHIAIRVVRRFLEQHMNDFDLIVFAVEDVDIGIYDHLMPLYFPRSDLEQEFACYYLPEEIGGQTGEPVIPERQIRISNQPVKSSNLHDFEQTIDLSSGLDSSVVVGKTSFARMQPDVDRRWSLDVKKQQVVQTKSDPVTNELQRRTKYSRIVRLAKQQDFSDMECMRFLYTAGEDRLGRTIVVVMGHKLPFSTTDPKRILNYAIKLLDPIVMHKKFIVIYFHTLTGSRNSPGISFARQALQILDPHTYTNLQAMYVVHPTFWCRLVTWWFMTFSETAAVKEKIFFLSGLEYLKSLVQLEQLQIPPHIHSYDARLNAAS